MKQILSGVVATIILVTQINKASADAYWNNNNGQVPGGDRSWNNAANWSGTGVPTLPSAAGAGSAIINPWDTPSNWPIVNSSGNTANDVYLSTGGSLSVVNGGSLVASSYITGIWGNSGVTDVSGGLLQAGNFLVGRGSFDGDISISGGNIVANFLEIRTAGGAKFDISGGTVSTTTFSIYNPGGGAGMNIGANGSFVAAISELGNINYWINNQSMTANNGLAGWRLNVDTVSQSGKLVVTAVPEPSTFASFGMGLALLVATRSFRRKS